ncbi:MULTISPECIES: histidine--tRNA ligase [unclassified Tatumella]|uniref:histidine--tRNA ligase n=1 Tax=unclassified Tatumella TaxID=2649542 RepID=UPI001BAEAE06|nr:MULTISPECIES: histidine--tRNA ligase [unclassified Tatumella]MBS0877559.1 histidine--tRNA ligase [Tatumella sp. JGM82]MBS0891088.1 histidine--tRNA ligase [Tatumella sp. JGM94]MBS0894530.1 histidine--tRNA ligase [Tatumella sp. JGM130]MBS0902091.1 histidine--tRNA ligase [Tatumella sp. JGM100]
MNDIKSVRGMRDVLPDETPQWQWLEARFRQMAHRYGYQEMRLPLLEPVSLFERAVGVSTDIVSKEMYNFRDKSGENITLRPEGTSGCLRAVLENNMCYHKTQRLWYQGPMFRYERPQKGRLRQFTQFGAEAFGMPGADIDAELIFMVRDLFTGLGLENHVRLEINSLGNSSERQLHRQALVNWFSHHQQLLDEDSKMRLAINPLRILDSKNPRLQTLIEQAPRLTDFLQQDSQQHFATLCELLDKAEIAYRINPRLVRGLDYYSHTVFEWITDDLGAQGTVCGGGRYDGLAELFSGKPLPCCGFAIGIERLLLLLAATNRTVTDHRHVPDIVVTSELSDGGISALLLAEQLRRRFTTLRVLTDSSGARLKRQHQNALNSQCRIIITLNHDGHIRLWDLQSQQQSETDNAGLMTMIAARQQHWQKSTPNSDRP